MSPAIPLGKGLEGCAGGGIDCFYVNSTFVCCGEAVAFFERVSQSKNEKIEATEFGVWHDKWTLAWKFSVLGDVGGAPPSCPSPSLILLLVRILCQFDSEVASVFSRTASDEVFRGPPIQFHIRLASNLIVSAPWARGLCPTTALLIFLRSKLPKMYDSRAVLASVDRSGEYGNPSTLFEAVVGGKA